MERFYDSEEGPKNHFKTLDWLRIASNDTKTVKRSCSILLESGLLAGTNLISTVWSTSFKPSTDWSGLRMERFCDTQKARKIA